MATVSEITRALAELTQPEEAPEWDPVGLQLGDPDAQVGSVAVCHEVNEEVVARLEEQPVDLLVTYHPLLFTPVNRLVTGRSAQARAYRLIRAGISLVVTHTDFDMAEGGTADSLAKVYQLLDVSPFGGDHVSPFGGDDVSPLGGAEESRVPPIGRVGDFDGSLGVLDAMTADAFGSNGLRVSGDRRTELEKLAVVPGSGASFIEAAAEVADALVTGDVSHHRAVRALDLGLAIVDPGHVATERPGMEALVRMVSEISDVTHDLTGIDPTTWS